MKILLTLLIVLASLIGVIVICGIYDVARNRKLDKNLLRRYFLGNGLLTWTLSPFNTLLDLLSLPYINRGVYRLEDLPKAHQEEIRRLMDAAANENLVAKLEELAKESPRTMIFFKWYGANVDSRIHIPAFHEKYRHIKTIGVSIFNKKQSTSQHFGPFRAMFRVLYNINDMEDQSAYIVVGDVTNYWKDHKLFIFDDTLMHQSINESDKIRYCLFVDILRPTLMPGLFSGLIGGARFCLQGINSVFYDKWKVIRN